MDPTRYFEDHWREIDSERLDRYELMFAWRPEHDVLIAPACIEAGQTVLEDVTVFTLGFGTVPAPETVTTGEAASADGGRLDANLVRLDSARVTDTTTVSGDFEVTLR